MDALLLSGGIAPEAISALVEGRHGDPFSILGPHAGADGEVVVRAFLPGAVGLTILDRSNGAQLAVASLLHPAGLFAATLTEGAAYLLQIQWPDAVQVTEDPYSFGVQLGDLDLHLIGQGTHYNLTQALGANPVTVEGVEGVRFAVWAPNARRVSVVGDFNAWDGRRHPMRLRQPVGIWEIFVPRLTAGERYKYEIIDQHGTVLPQKADPVGRSAEAAPSTASIVASSAPFDWHDADWMRSQRERTKIDGPMSVYEVHVGSWVRDLADGNRSLDWIELSQRMIPYVRDMGFTHIELLPIMEHPFGGSWGYQPLGLFAPTGRYGTPEDFAYFIDRCHAHGIGVILDWVPAHFPTDIWGMARFDGTALYEHEDPREGFHKDWNTLIYNLGRNEVKGFLIASALEWLERYHVDGLRVDAVASMLYRDYSRAADEWIPNKFGGRENLESIEFFKHLNSIIHTRCPHAFTVAEESTAFPDVTRPPEEGGLGFDLKWNMGWMHDSLHYVEEDPVYRRYHHGSITFGMVYAYTERFMLPLSHDEVVHGKGSLLLKMPGDVWQKFANLRAYFGFMWGHPGKKLLFMGGEIGQSSEWNHDASVHWDLIDDPMHGGLQRLVRDLNRLYVQHAALHYGDIHPDGFEWAVVDDAENSVLAMLRYDRERQGAVLVVSNFTPVPRTGYRIGVSGGGSWQVILNSDAGVYGGANSYVGDATAEPIAAHGHPFSIQADLPALSTVMFRLTRE
ncbi:1,4-alpha-glucan branching protein GlgB [Rhizobium glycinendophyticum]|uniref:1,4-alpha-glucan branching enzyme GlgB n=1 Tax=Rhizobium glycinendophyticum TaxID=2589807 RepID=A0A504TRX2_9HYPH|nr:1,4-alpha-glucan branching protein GlgB [Rhizobium glycinendophyticum]TPP04257.1 1,4-alpha-glucan branching protein GlgB [Rhizobium glycinendophyticum]